MVMEDKKQFDIIAFIKKKMVDENGDIITRSDHIKQVEREVYYHLKKHTSDITLVDGESGLSLGMLCALYGMEEIVMMCLDNEKARYQQSSNKKYLNYNLGMFAAKKGMFKATLKALNSIDNGYHQNADGKNIGMIAAEMDMEEAVIKALNNIYASSQQDKDGYNIGMYAALHKMERAAILALDDPIAAIQQNIDGDNIGMISARNGLMKAAVKAQRDTLSVNQKNKKGQTIDSILQESNLVK